MDVAMTPVVVGGCLLLLGLALSQASMILLARFVMAAVAVSMLLILATFGVVEKTNASRVALLEDRIEWKPGVLHRYSGYEPMPLAAVNAVLAKRGGRAFRIVAVEKGRVRALWVRPSRTQRATLRAALYERLGDVRWCETEAAFSERLRRLYEGLRRDAL
jgi:hypothetical protein